MADTIQSEEDFNGLVFPTETTDEDPPEVEELPVQEEDFSILFPDEPAQNPQRAAVPPLPKSKEETPAPNKISPADPLLLDSLEYQESRGNPYAIGPMTRYGTAKGPYQFIDSTWAEVAEPGESVFDKPVARKNASKYLTSLYNTYDQDINRALAAYNAGPGNVDKAIAKSLKRGGTDSYADIAPFLPKETQNYVPEILGRYNKNNPVLTAQVEKAKAPGIPADYEFGKQLTPILNTPEFQSLNAVDALSVVNKVYHQSNYAPETKGKLKEISKAIWDTASPEEIYAFNQEIGRPDREELENEKDPTKKLSEWKAAKIKEFEDAGIAPELLDAPLNRTFDEISKDEVEAANIRQMGFIGRFSRIFAGEFQTAAKGALDLPAGVAAYIARPISEALGASDYSTTIAKLPDTLIGDNSRVSKYEVDDKGYILLNEDGSPREAWDTPIFRAVGNALATISGGVALKVAGAGTTTVAAAVGSANALQLANQTFQSVYEATGDKEKAYLSSFLAMPVSEIGTLFQLAQISKFGTATTKGLSELNKIKYFAKEAARDTISGVPVFSLQDALLQGAESLSTGQKFSVERMVEAAAVGGVTAGLTGPVIKTLEYGKTLKKNAQIKQAVTSQLQAFQNSPATEMALPVAKEHIDPDALSVLGQTIAGKDESGNVRVTKTGAIPEESLTVDESLANVTKYLTPTEVMRYSQERGEILAALKNNSEALSQPAEDNFKIYEQKETTFESNTQQLFKPELLESEKESINRSLEREQLRADEYKAKLSKARSPARKEEWSRRLADSEERLVKEKEELDQLDPEKRREILPVKSSTTGTIVSKNISPGLRKTIDYWSAGFGLKNLHVLTPEDLKQGSFKGIVPADVLFRLKMRADEGKVAGLAYLDREAGNFILTNYADDSYKAHHVMSHEIGHILTEDRIFRLAGRGPEGGMRGYTQEARDLHDSLYREYDQYKADLGENVSDVAEGLQGPLGHLIKSQKKVSELGPNTKEYLVGNEGFKEFLSNQITEYALNPDKKPSTKAGSFLKKIGDSFRTIWERLKGKFKESPTLNQWLDEQFNSQRGLAALDAIERQTTATESLSDRSQVVRSEGVFNLMKEGKTRADVLKERLSFIDQKLTGTEDPTYFNKVKANEADFIQKEKEAGLPSRGVRFDKDRNEWVSESNPVLSDPFLKGILGLEQLEAPSKDPASTTLPVQTNYPSSPPQKAISANFTPRRFFSASNDTPMSPRRVVEAAKKIIGLAGGRGATIKEGGVRKKGVLGYYSPAAAVIRVRSLRDIPTFVHEVTHQVDSDLNDLVFREAAADPKLDAAFVETAQTFYPNPAVNKNKPLALREGLTKFLENYVIGEPVHKDLLNWWDTKFKNDHPEIHAQYQEVKRLSDEFYSQTPEARVKALETPDTPGLRERLKEKYGKIAFWNSLSDKDSIFREADKILGQEGRFNNKSYRGFIDAVDVSSKGYVTTLVNGDSFRDRQGNIIPGQKTLSQIGSGLTPEQQNSLRRGLIANQSREMIKRGQNPGSSIQATSQELLRYESNPDIAMLRQRQNEVYDWWTKTVDVLVADSPRMQESVRRIRKFNKETTGEEHGYYVPMQRLGFEDSAGTKSTKDGMSVTPDVSLARKGSDRGIKDIFDSFEQQAQVIGKNGLKNQLFDRLRSDLKNGLGAGNLIEAIPTKMQLKYETDYITALERGVKALKKQTGVDTGQQAADFIKALETATGAPTADILGASLQFFGAETNLKPFTKGYTVLAYPKSSGKGYEFYEVHPDVLQVFEGIEQTGILASPAFDAIVRTPKRVLQAGATTFNPVFQIKNFLLRDWQSALLLQEKDLHIGNFAKNMLLELGDQTVTKVTGRQTGAAAYAAAMGFNSASRAGAAKELAYVAQSRGLKAKIWNQGQKAIEILEWAGSLGENTTRLAAMKTMADKIGVDFYSNKKITSEQAIDLALAYKNATVNFSKRGSGTGITLLRESVPFFGARLAATSQGIEMAGEAPKRALALATTSFALGMYAYINNAKKDWYDDLSATTKSNSFVIDADGDMIAVPLDNFNAVFHGLGVLTAHQFIQSSDNEASTLEMLRELANQTSPIDLPLSGAGALSLLSAPGGPLIKSGLEQLTNKKFWTNAPIVDDQYKAPLQQFTRGTSEAVKGSAKVVTQLMQQVGFETQMSPQRMEYFISTYAAGPLKVEKFVEEQLGFKAPSESAAENIFLRAFTRDASNAAIQDQSRVAFYDVLSRANQNKYQETEPQGEARKLVNRVSKQITELNKQIIVEEDKEKRDLLYLQRRELFKEGASAWRAVKGQASEE